MHCSIRLGINSALIVGEGGRGGVSEHGRFVMALVGTLAGEAEAPNPVSRPLWWSLNP